MAAEQLVTIGTHLRLVMLGIECAHGIAVVHREIERALADARADADGSVDASAKRYLFRCAGGVRIEGEVDAFESETVRLLVDGHARLERDLARIVAAAGSCADQVDRDREDR